MARNLLRCLAASVLLLLGTDAALARPLLLISLDGLRPGDVLDADQRGLKIPNLRRFLREGTYANDVRGVLPTLTYPSHTTLMTGVAPGTHGIVSNTTFDPLLINQEGWYWYASDVRVPTLWDAAHLARMSTANVNWPVSVGAQIDYNLPQYWRTGHADDRKILRALSTPGLLDSLEHELGDYADGINEHIDGDETRARFAERILETRHPVFMTAYFTALDTTQHVRGPDMPEGHAVLERLDAIVGRLVAAARKSDPQAVIAVVSDHGFAPVAHMVNLTRYFAQADLLAVDDHGEVTRWDAEPWYGGGSAGIMLRDPNDTAVRGKVSALLERLAADPANGIAQILSREDIAQRHGTADATFYVLFKPGYKMAPAKPTAPLFEPSRNLGMHGYAAELAEMRSTFLILGPGIKAGRALGSIDMRDIAPTLAHELGISLPQAEGKSLL